MMENIAVTGIVNSINDYCFSYPFCIACACKIAQTSPHIWTCSRCRQSHTESQVQHRYRLNLAVTDGCDICKVTTFGKPLEKLFGVSPDSFREYVSHCETSLHGKPESVTKLLQKAMNTYFCGSVFRFSFKVPLSRLSKCNRVLGVNLRCVLDFFGTNDLVAVDINAVGDVLQKCFLKDVLRKTVDNYIAQTNKSILWHEPNSESFIREADLTPNASPPNNYMYHSLLDGISFSKWHEDSLDQTGFEIQNAKNDASIKNTSMNFTEKRFVDDNSVSKTQGFNVNETNSSFLHSNSDKLYKLVEDLPGESQTESGDFQVMTSTPLKLGISDEQRKSSLF